MHQAFVYEASRRNTRAIWTYADCTAEQADAAALASGWAPPRWWQWRRWLDYPRRPYGGRG
jgi:hypothetical protein